MVHEYKCIGEVSSLVDGLPTKLRLAVRSYPGVLPHHVVSWRTVYRRGGTNRRFYWSPEEGPWVIPASHALDLMERAERQGLLSDAHDHSYQRNQTGSTHFDISSEMDEAARRRMLDEITCAHGEADWGPNPFFVVATDGTGDWRKIMILDSPRILVTFRSTTTDAHYRPIKDMGKSGMWRLDNAMIDASTETMRGFLRHLRRVMKTSTAR